MEFGAILKLIGGAVGIAAFGLLLVSCLLHARRALRALCGQAELGDPQCDSLAPATAQYRQGMLRAFCIGVGTRLLVLVLGAVLWKLTVGFHQNTPFYTIWTRWDATAYLRIAREGYGLSLEGDMYYQLVFFPLYPWLVRLFMLVFRDSYVSATVLSTLLFGGCCALLYRLTREDAQESTARLAVWVLVLCPYSFFFCAPYSESLFLFLMLAVALCCRRGRFFLAGLFGMLAAFTRIPGGLALGYIALEAMFQRADWKKKLGRIACSLLVLLGFVGYLLLNWHYHGDPFYFLVLQKETWFQQFGWFFNTVGYTLEHVYTAERDQRFTIWVPQFVAILLSAGIMLWERQRMRASEAIYGLVYWVVTISPTWLLSGARYLMCIFFLPRLVAGWLERGKTLRKALFFGLCIALMMVYTVLYLSSLNVL